MYLKSIEVQGFKSFANKIVFDFHNGITGIVGPNGSGKSNVADAVRWVLGEQSAKQLRGSKMEDVIFAGTENRKPVGFPFVSITLDNSDHALPVDYDEVTVSRRVYRSGESEYLINGNSCRLKDVTEMFYDTGILLSDRDRLIRFFLESLMKGESFLMKPLELLSSKEEKLLQSRNLKMSGLILSVLMIFYQSLKNRSDHYRSSLKRPRNILTIKLI